MKKNYFVDKKRIKFPINKKIGEVILTKNRLCNRTAYFFVNITSPIFLFIGDFIRFLSTK